MLPAVMAATTATYPGTNSFERGHRSGSDGREDSRAAAPSGACLLSGGVPPSCMPRAPPYIILVVFCRVPFFLPPVSYFGLGDER